MVKGFYALAAISYNCIHEPLP